MAQDSTYLPIARTGGAYGVRGWIRVVPFENGEALACTKTWHFIAMNGSERDFAVKELKVHGNQLLAKLEGIDNKEDADRLRGQLAVRREDFPELEDDEHYLVDIMGCLVINREGVELGEVTQLGDNGVQDILVVSAPVPEGSKPKQYLIPCVEQYVDEIDTDAKRITVDWQPDWV